MQEVVVALAHGRGIAVIATGGRLQGVITAGDLTRLAERQPDYLTVRASVVMTAEPRVAHGDEFAAQALGQLERHGIMAAPVLDGDGWIVGVVHLHDLLAGRGRVRAALASIALLAACGDRGVAPRQVAAVDSADQVYDSMTFDITRDGVKTSRVQAESAWVYQGRQVADLKNMTVTMYRLDRRDDFDNDGRQGYLRDARAEPRCAGPRRRARSRRPGAQDRTPRV